MAVWIVPSVVFLAFFPVFVCVAGRFDERSKRLCFYVDVLFFRVFGGYGEKREGKIFIHTRNNKAKKIKKRNFNAGSLKLLKAFSVTSVRMAVRFTPGQFVCVPLIYALRNVFYPVIRTERPLSDRKLVFFEGSSFSFAVKIGAYISVASLLFVFLEVAWKKIRKIWLKTL